MLYEEHYTHAQLVLENARMGHIEEAIKIQSCYVMGTKRVVS